MSSQLVETCHYGLTKREKKSKKGNAALESLYLRNFSAGSLLDVAVAASVMVDSTMVAEEIIRRVELFASSPIARVPMLAASVIASVLSSSLPIRAALNRCFALSRVSGRPR